MRLLHKKEVREEGAGPVAREGYAVEVSMSQSGGEAVVLTEPAADSSIGRSSSQKLAASVGKRAAAVHCAPGKSEISRQSKKRRISKCAAEDKKMPEAQENASLSLQATSVVEAIGFLDTLPAGERADELRDLSLQWRVGLQSAALESLLSGFQARRWTAALESRYSLLSGFQTRRPDEQAQSEGTCRRRQLRRRTD